MGGAGWLCCSVGALIATSGKLNLTDMSAYGRKASYTLLMQFQLAELQATTKLLIWKL